VRRRSPALAARAALPALLAAHVAGIVLADRGALGPDAALVAGALALLGAALTRGRARFAAALLATAGAGAFHVGVALEAADRAPPAPVEATVDARVAEVLRTPHWTRVDLAGARGPLAGDPPVPHRIRVYVRPGKGGALAAAVPGEQVRGRLRLRPAGGLRNPGAAEAGAARRRRGIAAVASPVHPTLTARLDAGGPGAALQRRRARTAARLQERGPGGALLAALALGDRGGLDPAHRDAFARLGAAHLLAVSGLHLALVAGAVYAAARRLVARIPALAARRDARELAMAAALAAAAGYALAAGWGVPVRRALLLLIALAVALLRGRPAARSHPLMAAGLVILALEPGALFSPGAWLSFAATAALVAAAGRAEGEGLRHAVGALARASATAFLATAPVAAAAFGVATPWAVPGNLVLVPWVGGLVLPAALASAGALAVAPAAPAAAALAGLAAGLAEATLEAVGAAAARLPGPTTGAAPAPVLLIVGTGLALAALAARSTGLRVAASLVVGGLFTLAPPAAVTPGPPRLVVLDVGAGDATLVQGRRGTLLVDAGAAFPGVDRGREAVAPALAALGVERLDALVLTHADVDHRGGAPALLRMLPVEALWLPPGGRSDPGFAAVREAAAGAGVSVAEHGAGDTPRRLGDLRVEILWPPRRPAAAAPDNDRSLVLRVSVGGGPRVLLPGDLEAAAEAQLVARGTDLRADLLKVAHHGSRSSSSRAFLAAVGGAAAVVSAPCHGRFGWPHPEVVDRLREQGYAIWWTGRDGAVLADLGPRPWLRGWGAPRCRLTGRSRR